MDIHYLFCIEVVKNYQPISRILSRAIIYLVASLLIQSCCLPSGIGRAALKRRYTWHYSTQGLPKNIVTNTFRELLPHIFTLITPKRDSYFLWHFLSDKIGTGH